MILQKDYFKKSLSDFDEELWNKSNKVSLNKLRKINIFKDKSLKEKYNDLIYSFPYLIIKASDKIVISLYTIELNKLFNSEFSYDTSDDDEISQDVINEILNLRKNYEIQDTDKFLISDLVDSFIHSLIYWYQMFLERVRKYYFFAGIEDEITILKNLLVLYRSVINDKLIQVNIFEGLILTKSLSDKIIIMLIDFIEQRLLVLNPELSSIDSTNKINHINQSNEKIKWLGKQQDLIELFFELSEKKWIEKPIYLTKKSYSNSILSLFDISETRKRENSDIEASFYQKFKGDFKNGKTVYEFLEKQDAKRNFNKIRTNIKEK